MRITTLRLRERMDNPPVTILTAERYDMALESGLVRVTSKDANAKLKEWYVPLSAVCWFEGSKGK